MSASNARAARPRRTPCSTRRAASAGSRSSGESRETTINPERPVHPQDADRHRRLVLRQLGVSRDRSLHHRPRAARREARHPSIQRSTRLPRRSARSTHARPEKAVFAADRLRRRSDRDVHARSRDRPVPRLQPRGLAAVAGRHGPHARQPLDLGVATGPSRQPGRRHRGDQGAPPRPTASRRPD